MQLAHDWPRRLSKEARDRVQDALERGCRCEGSTANLTARVIHGGGRVIVLQCTSCGRSIGNSHPRALHPNWADYPKWDPALEEIWDAAEAERSAAEFDQLQSECEQRNEAWLAGKVARQLEYNAFLKTPDWRRHRYRVLERANFRCEACLERRAEEVHHRTYSFGWLPPAFVLVALCWECHGRLHAEGDPWNGAPAAEPEAGAVQP
jgi:hypothetical protein